MSLRARALSTLLAVLTALCGCTRYRPVAHPSRSLSHEIEVHFPSPRDVTARTRRGTVEQLSSVRRLRGRPVAVWLDTLHLSTAWFETDKGWHSFSDPAVVRVPIAESGVRLAERRVSPWDTAAVVVIGTYVAFQIVILILYVTTYDAAT